MEIILEIDGMHCATCALAVEKALKKASGVSEANVNFATEMAYVTCEDNTDIDVLLDAVKTTGYTAYPEE